MWSGKAMEENNTAKKHPEPTKSKVPKRISPLKQVQDQMKWNLERLNRAFARCNSKRFFDFLTVGTSNKKPEELMHLLKLPVFSCNHLVDVRNNPFSVHTPYWNKTPVSELCKVAGITYVHEPNLGVPSNIRKLLFSGQMTNDQLFSWYDNNVLVESNMEKIVQQIRDNNVAFMCTEIGPSYCHRHRIALKLENLGYISFDL